MKKKLLFSGIIILVLLCGMGALDFLRVEHFEKSIFARPVYTVDDGGSGIYQGLGYSFEIEGNFLPEAEFPGVVSYEGYLFGSMVASGVRE